MLRQGVESSLSGKLQFFLSIFGVVEFKLSKLAIGKQIIE